jgi:hypothetical protein
MLVTATGSKLWRFGYRYDGKQKLLAIGLYPIISLVDARSKRDDAKRLLADGIDPSVERKAERRDARMARANTFEAVAKELMEKFEAEGDAATTLKKKQWLLDFANKDSAQCFVLRSPSGFEQEPALVRPWSAVRTRESQAGRGNHLPHDVHSERTPRRSANNPAARQPNRACASQPRSRCSPRPSVRRSASSARRTSGRTHRCAR